ncbi:UNVERIFIED_CONTAM: hypothetical protein K2H54_054697 [Gekko kuhli]
MADNKMPAENMDIQMKNEQDLDALQEDIEMSGGSNGNDTNENKATGHKSRSNEVDENEKETAMIVESLDSCKSNEFSSKSKTQKELIKTLQELKGHLPPDKRIKGKSCVLATLKYALRSIKQVKVGTYIFNSLKALQNDTKLTGLFVCVNNAIWSHLANEEYYQMMMINETYPCNLDILSYTVEEVDNITTEYIMKNAIAILEYLQWSW